MNESVLCPGDNLMEPRNPNTALIRDPARITSTDAWAILDAAFLRLNKRRMAEQARRLKANSPSRQKTRYSNKQ